MQEKIFTVLYALPYQVQFREALKHEDFLLAREILEHVPQGLTFSEENQRLQMLVQGYRALLVAYEHSENDRYLDQKFEDDRRYTNDIGYSLLERSGEI